MKTKIEQIVKWSIGKLPLLSLCLLVAFALDYSVIKTTLFVLNPVHYEPIAGITVVRAAEEKEMPMKLWVLNEVYKAGLNPNEVDCIIYNESKWQDDAIGATKDYGLWQINIQHKGKISLKDMFDYKEATRWAIAKRLHDGNWNAWYAWKKYCK